MSDSTVLKEKVAHCHLKRLELYGREVLLPLLSGAKDNCSITDLHVESESITTCRAEQSSMEWCTCGEV